MISSKDFQNLKEFIKKNKKPLFIESKDKLKVAVVLSDEAKIFYQKKGFVSLTVSDIKEITETSESFEEAKERIEVVVNTAGIFRGMVL